MLSPDRKVHIQRTVAIEKLKKGELFEKFGKND